MRTDGDHIKERSVDSLQQIYAVVIALAISQAIQSLLKDPVRGTVFDLEQITVGLPPLVAFLVTLVPFWHYCWTSAPSSSKLVFFLPLAGR